jgi:soluble lytic murein transglycosylase-like protein
MRYLFAAVIAALVVTADFESSNSQSIWAEPAFITVAQSEPATVSTDSHNASVTAAVEPPSESNATNNNAAAQDEKPTQADAAAHAAASINHEPPSPNPICEAVKNAAEEHDIPIGFFARLLWQESRFRTREVSSAGARGIAQFMPRTAVEVGLKDPFDPLQAIPASAKFLRKLYDQFGNLGLAAAAYNAGGGRIEKWLSRRSTLPKETRDYVKIITGHKAEAWTDEENIISMPIDLPPKAPCEGVGGLSKDDQIAEVPVDLTASASAKVRTAEASDADDKNNEAVKETVKKPRLAASQTGRATKVARKINGRTVVLAAKGATRKHGKRTTVRFASSTASRTR